MALSADEVAQIAHLARLEISAEDIPVYAQTLSNMLDLVAQMNAADTQNVLPMIQSVQTSQRLRADVVTEGDQRELLQQQAPLVQDGLYLVPKVIE